MFVTEELKCAEEGGNILRRTKEQIPTEYPSTYLAHHQKRSNHKIIMMFVSEFVDFCRRRTQKSSTKEGPRVTCMYGYAPVGSHLLAINRKSYKPFLVMVRPFASLLLLLTMDVGDIFAVRSDSAECVAESCDSWW